MKKIFILLVLIFSLFGCGKKLTEEQEKKLNNMLMQEAKEIFEVDEWINGGIKEGTYTVTLRDIKEKMNKDISKYVNPNTDEMCDLDKTKIDFIVSKQKKENLTDYNIEITIACE